MAERIFGGALTGLLHCVGRKQPSHGYRPHLAVLYAFCAGLELFGSPPHRTSSSPPGEWAPPLRWWVATRPAKGQPAYEPERLAAETWDNPPSEGNDAQNAIAMRRLGYRVR